VAAVIEYLDALVLAAVAFPAGACGWWLRETVEAFRADVGG
jgi:outer membrane lipopolysaccharide assembly protein LptE/RlpB